MKLFFSPGATSLSAHIVLHEAGLSAELVRVDLEAQTIPATGQAFSEINPMGKVPALQLDDGCVLTEGSAVLQYLADLAPGSRLAPSAGSFARYRLAEALNFLASEVHKGYAPMFDSEVPPSYKQRLMQDTRTLERVAALVAPGPFVLGDTFTVADAYLYSLLRLAQHAGLDFSRWPSITRFIDRIASRPSVRACIRVEGLIEA